MIGGTILEDSGKSPPNMEPTCMGSFLGLSPSVAAV